mgnify:CR=1 FL=1
MGNQYSEQYYIDKISSLEEDIYGLDQTLQIHRKSIKIFNNKMDLMTEAISSVIQKNKELAELNDTLQQYKSFFEKNDHIFNIDSFKDEDSEDSESEEESKEVRKQPIRKCKQITPKRIQPKRKVKKATQPTSFYVH